MSTKYTWKEARSEDIRYVVRDTEWQNLRKNFLGTWKIRESENVHKLREYLGKMDDPLKVRRVLNYLTGTAFRIGLIGTGKETQELLADIRVLWRKKQSLK